MRFHDSTRRGGLYGHSSSAESGEHAVRVEPWARGLWAAPRRKAVSEYVSRSVASWGRQEARCGGESGRLTAWQQVSASASAMQVRELAGRGSRARNGRRSSRACRRCVERVGLT
jgi:hypothetical protein